MKSVSLLYYVWACRNLCVRMHSACYCSLLLLFFFLVIMHISVFYFVFFLFLSVNHSCCVFVLVCLFHRVWMWKPTGIMLPTIRTQTMWKVSVHSLSLSFLSLLSFFRHHSVYFLCYGHPYTYSNSKSPFKTLLKHYYCVQ